MTLRPDDLRRLEAEAAAFSADPRSFLAETMQCLRRHRDPHLALTLLAGMFGTHVDRANEQRALNDAGKWFEKRILREPEVTVDRLLQELGWLQRINVIRQTRGDAARTTPTNGTVHREFGDRLQQLRDRKASPRPAPSLHGEDPRRTRVEALLRDLAPNNAATALPELLADPDPAVRRTLAERCVVALTRKRVRDAQRASKAWVRPLTETLGELP